MIVPEVFMVFGKQDPYVPAEGRLKLYSSFLTSGLNYQWLEVNAVHAFMRDEGDRYDPALGLEMYGPPKLSISITSLLILRYSNNLLWRWYFNTRFPKRFIDGQIQLAGGNNNQLHITNMTA